MQKVQNFITFILRFVFGNNRATTSKKAETGDKQEAAVTEPENVVTAQFGKKKFLVVLVGVGILGGFALGFIGPAREKVAQLFGREFDEEEIARQELLEELEQLLGQVGKHMIIPSLEEEEPLLATVLDAAALVAEQPFYSDVIDGDKVLIYPQSLRAIIYSPERDIIVNVGPVQVSPPQNNPVVTRQEPQAAAQEVLSVLTLDIRNGSGQNGIASALAKELGEEETYSVLSVADASSTYPKTLVVDQTDGENDALMKVLAERLGAAIVTAVPNGEEASAAEAIIIIGKEEN